MENASEKKLAGVIGFFDGPHSTVEGMKKVRSAGFQSFDAYTPYPIHGMDAAQGLKRSWIPYVTFIAGLTGVSLAFGLQYWTSAIEWPLNVGGKPFNSWPAFVPVMFELTVLLGGLSTVGAMLFANGLPNMTKKTFDPGITSDKFCIVIESPCHVQEGPRKFSENEASDVLRQAGAKEVRAVYHEGWF